MVQGSHHRPGRHVLIRRRGLRRGHNDLPPPPPKTTTLTTKLMMVLPVRLWIKHGGERRSDRTLFCTLDDGDWNHDAAASIGLLLAPKRDDREASGHKRVTGMLCQL